MAHVSKLALAVYKPRREWLSETLLAYNIISESLAGLSISDDGDDYSSESGDDDDESYLKSLDPRDWKDQDHYAVLGLRNKRIKATDDEIKRAYRKKLLVHHPDKRGVVVDNESDYFACITKAFEILGDPIKRRSYDSVDPTVDDTIPVVNKNAKNNFFAVFGPVFERNARWSVKQPVPQLGHMDSPAEDVHEFYNFWTEFESWREYSYEDEEEKEKGQDREERRWIEKENRAIRAKKKKEEMARIRQLVESAMACDPRIPRIKREEKEQREREKARQRELRAQKLAAEEAERQRAAREAAEREARERERQAKNRAWTNEEQRLLEEALVKFPKGTDERWAKVASHIPSRTAEDCFRRFNELRDLVRAKKKAVNGSASNGRTTPVPSRK